MTLCDTPCPRTEHGNDKSQTAGYEELLNSIQRSDWGGGTSENDFTRVQY